MKTIGYMISGYPSLKQCVEISKAYIAGGCDMLEISIPLEENLEAPYLCDLMRTTVQKYPDYEQHLNVIREITRMYPYITYTLLIYKEVMDGIGVSRLGEFCRECGILYINSPDITDQESIGILKSYGVRLAGLILYDWDKEMMETAKKADGFIYVQAFPGNASNLREGCETPEELITLLRRQGISNQLYCGGGIRTPEDVLRLKKAGADGFFLGTSILELSGRLEEIEKTIKAFRRAAASNAF
ncbi:tryptophan synthase subunit alpha [Diplocloster agilis]|uniref:tryptophan synthase subunit alpha n=1 Tax=Diplocloster agilis TaxID=2850323 RepID=UPI000821B5B9|nr:MULTISPECIES: tryptophan synthase subunit alpha [Lachnospiraceae]MBU9744438.1 tryptophan synthase subunit alpha [Diplocloster agilis]MCU6735774.1 tryptophan synthase subunit alpha [Suonthocola fibrivorans]SCJ81568.1 Tryptophan synthase alpha chain [uncultured Clostridium sp.]